MYRSSIEVLTADKRKDLRDYVELKANFPKLRIIHGSCEQTLDRSYYVYRVHNSPQSSATIEFGQDGSKPRLDLKPCKGESITDPKFGLWPPERGVFDLRKLITMGAGETWEFGYGRSDSSEEDAAKIYPFRCEGLDEEVFFRTVFVHVEMVDLRACATKLSHLRAIVDVAHGLKRLDVVVSKGPNVGWGEEKRQSKEMAQQFDKTVVKLGHLEHLEHLNLFAEKEKLSCLHHMQTLPWKALRTLECNVEPSIVLRKRYGRKRKPRQLLRPPQSPPPGKLEKVVIHLNGELHRSPNPTYFAYALLEIFPLDVEIGITKGESSSFGEVGLDFEDYQYGFEAITFQKWVKGALKAMVKEMTTGPEAVLKADANGGSGEEASDHDGGSDGNARSDDDDESDDDCYDYDYDGSD